ncbi:MAG TPA: metal-sensitive transcriptional regulator [Caldilineaceae bacterium]|nr:metal-sensitive transcriptional regulator [Caldilineaceae bacterium]
MDSATRTEVINRLKSVEGHVRGVRHMVEEQQPCMAILQQTQAIQGSLRQISLLLLEQHLNGCLRELWNETNDDVHRQMRDELLALFTQKTE